MDIMVFGVLELEDLCGRFLQCTHRTCLLSQVCPSDGSQFQIYLSTYLSIHPSIHTCMHACLHTYIRTYVHTYIHTLQYNAMQCNAMQCNAMPYHTIPYNTIQYNTIQYIHTYIRFFFVINFYNSCIVFTSHLWVLLDLDTTYINIYIYTYTHTHFRNTFDKPTVAPSKVPAVRLHP